MKLTPDQVEVKSELREALIKHRAAILEASTGFGKTTLTAEILKTTQSAWFVVHRKRLFKDVERTLEREGIDYGYIAAGRPYVAGHKVYICMARTLANRIDDIPEPHLVVIDEAHNVAAKTYDKIVTKGNFRLLLTATPERSDGRGLGEYAPVMVSAPPMTWLIENKRLSPFRYFAPSNIDRKDLKKQGADFSNSSVDDAFQKSTIHGDCIEHYKKHADGVTALVFCHSIKAAQETAEQFIAAGIPAASLESSIGDDEGDEVCEALAAGNLQVVTSVNMVLEGYDLPAIGCVIWKRPTDSLIVSKQGNGRGLRYIEGKTCIILDLVGNYTRHGLPDRVIDWNLEGKKKRDTEANIAVRECKVCQACFSPAPECPECGAPVVVEERVIKQTKGELAEIKQHEMQERKKERGKAQTLDQLVQLGKDRGYKNPKFWALKVYKGRK